MKILPETREETEIFFAYAMRARTTRLTIVPISECAPFNSGLPHVAPINYINYIAHWLGAARAAACMCLPALCDRA